MKVGNFNHGESFETLGLQFVANTGVLDGPCNMNQPHHHGFLS